MMTLQGKVNGIAKMAADPNVQRASDPALQRRFTVTKGMSMTSLLLLSNLHTL
eukprot:m.253068 g.253068  ORF g.253068 m.253068 type:complete len:53 (+) comp26715_c0_seq6:2768-2926(+)